MFVADESLICIDLYGGVVAAPRQGLSSLPVCTRTSHLLICSVLNAPGYPSFPINADALQRFSIQTEDKGKTVSPPEKLQCDAIPKSRRKFDYNTVDYSLLAEIDAMELCGSYGTKIDTLVRHLLYLQVTDSGAKSIVFSAWEDSLHSAHYSVLTRIRTIDDSTFLKIVVEHALAGNGMSGSNMQLTTCLALLGHDQAFRVFGSTREIASKTRQLGFAMTPISSCSSFMGVS